MRNEQPPFDIRAAIGSEYNLRSNPNKANFPSRSDLNSLENDIEERRRIALAKIRENQLRNAPKIEEFEQARLKVKQVIFQKFYRIIEKELEVLKVEMKSQNEYNDEYSSLFEITLYQYSDNMRTKLKLFQRKLRWVRSTTCHFKYCYPDKSRCYCFGQWFCSWCFLPCICCYSGWLKEDKCHVRLHQLYERYQQLMVAENQAVECPLV